MTTACGAPTGAWWRTPMAGSSRAPRTPGPRSAVDRTAARERDEAGYDATQDHEEAEPLRRRARGPPARAGEAVRRRIIAQRRRFHPAAAGARDGVLLGRRLDPSRSAPKDAQPRQP